MYKNKFLPLFPSPCGQIGPLRRFVGISLTVWVALGLYFIIDCCQSAPPTTVVMPSWVPFWPVFTLPYLGMLLVTWLLPVTIRDAGRFRACLQAFICAFLLVMPWWVLTPTTLPRPPLPEDWWAGPYRWITAIDPPNNVMPCAHGIGPVVGAWFAGRDRPTWRWLLVGMLVLGLPSIALVWQHRPFDIMLGTVAAAIGIAIGESLNRLREAAAGASLQTTPVAHSQAASRPRRGSDIER
jgi:hypothetical protein